MGIFLDKYKKKEKNILGSNFGGGWGLSTLIKEKDEEEKEEEERQNYQKALKEFVKDMKDKE